MWMGFTVYPKILVVILIVFFPIMVNVLTAIRTVDPDMINLARSFSATRWQMFRMIEYPATMGPLFSGLRIGATLARLGLPTVLVQEGGYLGPSLPTNAVDFLGAFDAARASARADASGDTESRA